MPRRSAGLIMYRCVDRLEVFLVHPGGPHFAKKDLGIWTVPKGEYLEGELPLDAAKREFQEETGFPVSEPFLYLDSITQKGGKIVTAWAFEGDCDPAKMISNLCEVEWPPRSGRIIEIPEADRGAWFTIDEAKEHIKETQIPLLDRLSAALKLSK
jgi:predicted NUDIX family NTP pyrophosphohydrolase